MFCFVRNWVQLHINENENHCAQLIQSSYFRLQFSVFPSDIWCKINKLLIKSTMNIYSPNVALIDLVTVFYAILTSRQVREKLQFLYGNLMPNNFCRTAPKKLLCHDFHHCCRWLHRHYSRGCLVRFYFNEAAFNSDNLILKVL